MRIHKLTEGCTEVKVVLKNSTGGRGICRQEKESNQAESERSDYCDVSRLISKKKKRARLAIRWGKRRGRRREGGIKMAPSRARKRKRENVGRHRGGEEVGLGEIKK